MQSALPSMQRLKVQVNASNGFTTILLPLMKRSLFTFLILGSIALTACSGGPPKIDITLDNTVGITGLSAESHKTTTGNPNAAVTVMEFGDFQCPACGAAYPQIVEPLLQKYGSQIRYEFKQVPLAKHEYGLLAAEASECAADEGKFWQFVDLDYKNQSDLNKDTLYKWADQLGLTKDLFDRCLRSGIKKKAILADVNEGLALGIHGVPTFFVNGQQVASSLDAIGAAIEAASKASQKP